MQSVAYLLGFGLDVLVIVLLAVTIYYAMKLSRSLEGFRRHRSEFDATLRQLNDNIFKAQTVLSDLKAVEEDPNGRISAIMEESKTLIDELRLMNDAGNALAGRLERLARDVTEDKTSVSKPRAGVIAADDVDDAGDSEDDNNSYLKNVRHIKKEPLQAHISIRDIPKEYDMPSFMIRDSLQDPHVETGGDALDFDKEIQGLSQAERDLYEALKRKNKA